MNGRSDCITSASTVQSPGAIKIQLHQRHHRGVLTSAWSRGSIDDNAAQQLPKRRLRASMTTTRA